MPGGTKVHIILTTVAWGLLLYLVYCCFLFLVQRHVLFPRHLIETPPELEKNTSGIEKRWLTTNFGKIETWFLPATRPGGSGPSPAVIFAHGNGELIDFWPAELEKFTHLGIGVLLVEYPGYGRSEGRPSQQSIEEAFVTAYDLLVQRADVDASKIILIGRSIGGGAVCLLADKRPSAALILMSTFTSARSFAPRYLVPGFLMRDPLDNLSVVESYPNPVLIIHGNHDETIPYRHGVSLFKAAKNGKMITYDSGHNDCPPNWDQFWQDVESYLHSIGL